MYLARLANLIFLAGILAGSVTYCLYADSFFSFNTDWHAYFIYACFTVPVIIINYMVFGQLRVWNYKADIHNKKL